MLVSVGLCEEDGNPATVASEGLWGLPWVTYCYWVGDVQASSLNLASSMQRHHEKYKMSVQTVQTVAPSTLQHDYIYILHEFPLKKYVQFTLPSHSWHFLTMFPPTSKYPRPSSGFSPFKDPTAWMAFLPHPGSLKVTYMKCCVFLREDSLLPTYAYIIYDLFSSWWWRASLLGAWKIIPMTCNSVVFNNPFHPWDPFFWLKNWG